MSWPIKWSVKASSSGKQVKRMPENDTEIPERKKLARKFNPQWLINKKWLRYDNNNQLMFWDPCTDMYRTWETNAIEFLDYLKIFIQSFRELRPGKAAYTRLLEQFTRLCLLFPEFGETVELRSWIKGKPLTATPDIRFPCLINDGQSLIVTMAEVKQKNIDFVDITEKDNFHIGNLTDGILGQHGLELLLERKKSCFLPVSPGLICIGTKLIFTILDIDGEPYGRLLTDDSQDDSLKSNILYTRPYDYLDSCDRNEILEILFWLGYLQRNGEK